MGTNEEAEKSKDSKDRWHDRLVNVALLSNGMNIGLNMGLLGPTLPDLALQTGSTIPEMSMVFIFSSIAYMIGSLACGLMLGRFEGYLLISLTLILQAATTAVAPWCTNLTLLTTVISLSYFFSTVIIAGTAFLCFRLERTRARVMTQSVFLLFNLGKSVVPFVVAPFLAEGDAVSSARPTPAPALGRGRQPLHWPKDWAEVILPKVNSSVPDGAAATSGVSSNVGYGYAIVAAFSVLIGILYLVVALKNGCHLWAASDDRKSGLESTTSVSGSGGGAGRKVAVMAGFFVMIFLQCGMESVDAGLLMSFLTEYLGRTKAMGVVANSVYQGVKVVACIVVVLTVKLLHPSCLLVIDLCFMLAATGLMTVSIYFMVGDGLLWTTFVLLAIGMSNSYATMATWLETRYPITGMVTSLLTIGFGLGSMVLPTLTTNLLDQQGPIMFPLVLLAGSVLCVIAYIITKVFMKEPCCPGPDTGGAEVVVSTVTASGERSPLLEGSTTRTDGGTLSEDKAPPKGGRTPRAWKRQSLSELAPDQCFHAYHTRFINDPSAPSEHTVIYEH